jgi:septal ring factor EnvC (AmiA/AmiB activator)
VVNWVICMSNVLDVVKRLEQAITDLETAFVEKLQEQQETIRNLEHLLNQTENVNSSLEVKTKTAAARLDRLSEKIRLLLGT